VKPQDHTDVTPDNIPRPKLELPQDVRDNFSSYINSLVDQATKNLCSSYTVDRHHKVIKEKDVDFVTLLSNVSTPSPPPLMVTDVDKAIAKQGSEFAKMLADLNGKLDRAIGKTVTPVFPSYDAAASTAPPAISAESGPSQTQPLLGMPIGFYPGQPEPPGSILGRPPVSTGLSGDDHRTVRWRHAGWTDDSGASGAGQRTGLSGSTRRTVCCNQCAGCFYTTASLRSADFGES